MEIIFHILKKILPLRPVLADVAELVDAPDLGSGAIRRGGSSPFVRTIPGDWFVVLSFPDIFKVILYEYYQRKY